MSASWLLKCLHWWFAAQQQRKAFSVSAACHQDVESCNSCILMWVLTFFSTPDDMLRHWGQLSILISHSTVTYLDFSPRMTGFSNRVVHVECVVDRLKMLPYLLRTLGYPFTIYRFNNASSSRIIKDCINSYFCRLRGLRLTALLQYRKHLSFLLFCFLFDSRILRFKKLFYRVIQLRKFTKLKWSSTRF
jgi:hypothetical protein